MHKSRISDRFNFRKKNPPESFSLFIKPITSDMFPNKINFLVKNFVTMLRTNFKSFREHFLFCYFRKNKTFECQKWHTFFLSKKYFRNFSGNSSWNYRNSTTLGFNAVKSLQILKVERWNWFLKVKIKFLSFAIL